MTSFPSITQVPVVLRLLLLPFAPLYALAARLRPLLYRWGLLTSKRLATPVIAVGNLTTGGSGKSPVVEYLLREAQRAGLEAAVISRGYGRQGGGLLRVRLENGGLALAEEMGDEPCMLARRNPAVPVYVGKNRAAAGRLAEIVDQPNVIVLDDAFQHLRLARDLNVLLVDAEQGLGNGFLLPLGNLREPAAAIRRADVVLITKVGLGDAEALRHRLEALRHRLETRLPNPNVSGVTSRVPVFSCDFNPQRLTRLDGGASLPLSTLQGKEISLWCAIAQPGGFRKTVEGLGASVSELRAFRDHHPYSAADMALLDARLADAPADAAQWLTTSKDAVKLQGRLEHGEKLWVLEMEVVPEPAARAFFFDFLSALKLR